ncbi:MAG: DEAD/DEAH box helicase [Simkaniaceae bacterium]
MLNLRKLKQDFSSSILDEGKEIFCEKKVVSAKILHMDVKTVRISAKVLGQYNNTYESELEIDRLECETVDSDCDCPYHYDCQHLAALLFYLEAHLDEMLVEFSKEADFDELHSEEEESAEEILEVIKVAQTKEEQRKEEQYQKQLLQEYISASEVLATSPFFLSAEKLPVDKAEFGVVFNLLDQKVNFVEIQLVLRLPSRSKPLHLPNIREFLDGMRYSEPIFIGGKQYYFTFDSFEEKERELVRMVIDYARVTEKLVSERGHKVAIIDTKAFGMILATSYQISLERLRKQGCSFKEENQFPMSCLFIGSLEAPLHFYSNFAHFQIGLEYIKPPANKLLLSPNLQVGDQTIMLEDAYFFECAKPGLIFQQVYYRFSEEITRQHLKTVRSLRDVTIPEHLFGTFIENSIPKLANFAQIKNSEVSEAFVTLPYVGKVEGVCDLSYLDGELEAAIHFKYEGKLIPGIASQTQMEHLDNFISNEGIIARNLVEERKIVESLFQGFIFNEESGTFVAKTEKKIVEFMTDVIPRYQDLVTFNCPQNLLDQFIYDETNFKLKLSDLNRMDLYEIELKVEGSLKGVKIDRLWECIVSKKTFLELSNREKGKKQEGGNKIPKILVLDLDKISAIIQLFDELGIEKLENHKIKRPIWTIANIDNSNFKSLPVEFSMTEKLSEIRKQMLGEKELKFSPVPKHVTADLRSYQVEGVQWLERLRSMFLNGILADDMGLGKTLQAIVAVTQYAKKGRPPSLIICPTSLLYNWKEEFTKFNGNLQVLVIDGVPATRRRLIEQLEDYDVIITSYSLLQKDIDLYQEREFSYMVLDEAQHIKNRGTRNAKSVKMVNARHRLILSGTPIENSLDELWSLFDFLMPGFLSSYDRFLEKYIRASGESQVKNLEYLRKKVSPFILRRMKSDVLDDLPPVSEITYHCQLTTVQKELYRSYAESARDELVKLVERDGFDKVQIHVLATLTRLKQICCHPAIFAKENPESGDSAKYEMLLDLLETLIEGNHKTVIFSQYTRMLQIMRDDFEKMGVRFVYLDGTSKNRLQIVKQFNEDEKIPIFLVSLKAGGTGLNLVGADTVIHYDMWWNPAVENQATDRVHRIGQKEKVSVYKLVTLGTIEEKIVDMQKRKQGLVKRIVSCDDEALTKLTWEDVLELLQT